MLGFSAIGRVALGALEDNGAALSVDYGSIVFTGQDVEFKLGRVFPADVGSFALTGQDATLTDGLFIFEMGTAAMTVTGQVARNTIQAKPHRRVTGTGFRFQLDDTLTARQH